MKYVFINGYILDGNKDMQPESGKAIFVDGDKIEKIAPADGNYAGYEVIDLQGQYIMPGLINLHIHLPATGKPKKKESDPKKLVKLLTSNNLLRMLVRKICLGSVQTQLKSGVTTVRTVGGVEAVDSKLRDEINAGKELGPRILAANMAVSVPGGHMAGSLATEATSPEEAAMQVKQILRDKPDLIKLMITGGVLDATVKGEPGALKMKPEIVKAACDVAHKAGLMVAAHVESAEGVRVALENGVDTIEHGAEPTDEILKLFKDRNAALVTTINAAVPFAFFDRSISHASEVAQFNGKVVFDGIVANSKRALEEGIPVGLGTDTGCPFITHYDYWRELCSFHKYVGVSNGFALYTATKVNAEIAKIDDITGTIEEGKSADMIVTAGNPLDDLTTLRNVKMVVMGGQIVNDLKIKKYPEVEREMDKIL